ncbi:GCK domain [Musa troglodytarum]|nr:GCK domain [Musa troglodytarum]
MKGGGCKDAFVAWEKCMQEAEKRDEDIVDKCSEAAALLEQCMDAHPDYYEPILRAEQALADAAVAAAANDRDLEDEKKRGKRS